MCKYIIQIISWYRVRPSAAGHTIILLILWPTQNPANCAGLWLEFITKQAGPKLPPTKYNQFRRNNAQKLAQYGGLL